VEIWGIRRDGILVSSDYDDISIKTGQGISSLLGANPFVEHSLLEIRPTEEAIASPSFKFSLPFQVERAPTVAILLCAYLRFGAFPGAVALPGPCIYHFIIHFQGP
jgi:hypothetical protein